MEPWTGTQRAFAVKVLAIGSTLQNKGGSIKTVRTPEHIAVVRDAIEKKSTPFCASSFCVTRAV
jgi:hypothetical protein